MRLLMAYLFGAIMACVGMAQEEGQAPKTQEIPQGEPQWITVWHIPTDAQKDGSPFTDIRCVVYAKSEPYAIIRSLTYFQGFMPEYMVKRMEFIEAAVRRPEGEKK